MKQFGVIGMLAGVALLGTSACAHFELVEGPEDELGRRAPAAAAAPADGSDNSRDGSAEGRADRSADGRAGSRADSRPGSRADSRPGSRAGSRAERSAEDRSRAAEDRSRRAALEAE
ncbi:MAG: hypothetical protein WEB88_02620, partial [Gemmatimonadota bacterium]